MRRFVLLFVVFVPLLLAGMTSALAFKTAAVANGGHVTVVNTDEAMLALVKSDASIADYQNGVLNLDFPGQPPGSTFTYASVFSIRSRAPGPVWVSIESVSGEASGAILTISAETTPTPTVLWQGGLSTNQIQLFNEQQFNLTVSVYVDPSAPAGSTKNLTIVVKGQ